MRGGNGRPTECAWVYGYTFDPEDPNVDITANGSGRRQDWYDRICNGYVVGIEWVDTPVGRCAGDHGRRIWCPDVWVEVQRAAPDAHPAHCAGGLRRSTGSRTSRTTRSSGSIRRHGQWATVSGTNVGRSGSTVSVQAIPQRLIVDAGDGNTITCEGAPPAFVQGMDPTTFQGCAHVYRDSSSMAANGETFPVTVTIEWAASWSASDGQGGSLGHAAHDVGGASAAGGREPGDRHRRRRLTAPCRPAFWVSEQARWSA